MDQPYCQILKAAGVRIRWSETSSSARLASRLSTMALRSLWVWRLTGLGGHEVDHLESPGRSEQARLTTGAVKTAEGTIIYPRS